MLIIVEGPDCVGKSYLVSELRERLRAYPPTDVTVVHAGPPTAHPLVEYELPVLPYRPTRERHLVCDRWHVGELVYPAVLGRPTKLDDAVLRHIELTLTSRGAVLVVLTPDEADVRACLERRGDPTFDPALTGAVLRGFTDAVPRTTLPLIWLKDWPDVNTVDLVVQEALYHAERASALTGFVTYVGPPDPHLLLLGDVRATGADPADRRPAFMPYPATSGHYLLRELEREHRRDPVTFTYGLANACDVDDARELWYALGQPFIVTLGRSADRAARAARLPVTRQRPHPQWVRRFHHHDGPAYARSLLGREEA